MRSSAWWQGGVAVFVALLLAACNRGPESVPTTGGDAQPGSAATSVADVAARRLQREQSLAWQRLPDAQRARIRDAAAAFNALPPDTQTSLRAEFARQDRSDQRGWLLGPQVGAAWPHLQPLLAQVPEDQREPLLRILGEMPPEQLHEFERIAWRTPPEQRDALRQSFIATTPATRMAWLYEQAQR